MEFRIADTFIDSLARLTGDEQKAVKTTVFDLQVDPSNPGMQFHRLDRAKDKNFWSVRVSRDLRLIVHKTDSNLLICFVGHHDPAYNWAERRKLETHPKTGAAQIVEVRETVKEITVPVYVEEKKSKPPLFENISNEELLNYGVPEEWLNDVKNANEDSILELVDHLPAEAAEALLDLATGVKPVVRITKSEKAIEDPFSHPEAQRRFRVMHNVDELERAMKYPWEKWTVFLHPSQKQVIERDYNGPARVSGSAGTGKTVVALHRAVYLAKKDTDSRVLLSTFSKTLANALATKLRRLIYDQPRLGERLEVHSMTELGKRLYELSFKEIPQIASSDVVRKIVIEESKTEDHKFSDNFLYTEWDQVVDAWQLETWEAYRDVMRLGRKTRLAEKQRTVLWAIFDKVRCRLKKEKLMTESEMFSRLATHFQKVKNKPYDYMVIDESQDISVAQLRFLASVGADRENGLFFAGDLGQRIFQQPFSWKALGVDIRGRSSNLRINYRTSHQIRMHADRLLSPEIADVDGNVENRSGAISVFNGPDPVIISNDSQDDEISAVSDWLTGKIKEGILPHEIGLFVRSDAQLTRAESVLKQLGTQYKILDENVDTTNGYISLCTMHLAKGLEFRVVVVMACDDEVIPLQERIETVTDDSDLEEVYNTERHLLYVACTRARDHLLVSGVDPISEFVDDLTSQ